MKKPKILFLDLDGVLNSGDYSKILYKLHQMDGSIKSRDDYGTLFDDRCVRWLEWIILKTDCKIVISSTWKRDGLRRLQEMWEVRDLPGEVIDITPSIISGELFELYAEPQADRGYEIQEWLETHSCDSYCIIDDMDDMLHHQKFVRTQKRYGIDFDVAKQVVEILNKI